jgi:hypothetical protein
VVVTCTRRKRRPTPRELCLRHITGVRIPTRLRAWTERLASTPTPTDTAADLYAGEHWEVARRLPDASAGSNVDLWVCSAGYGLIPSTAAIRPYSATFSPGSPDSVPGGAEGAAAWWNALCTWKGPADGPRSIASLLAEDPEARILLCLSASYLRACADDIAEAVQEAPTSGRLSIISAGTKAHPDLDEWILPADARLQAALGGTRQALNVRVAEHLLAKGVIDHEEMKETLAKLLVDQPPLPRYDRRPASDAEIRTFIRAAVRTDASATHTRLLRQFRDEGRACEQSRFASLFRAETRRLR